MRIIARLDIKNDWVIKGIHLEGLRKVGNPIELATKYYEEGAHELLFMDAVASLYDRNNLFHIIEKACEKVFVPITIGGGIRSVSDASDALAAGADKIAINTAAVRNVDLVSDIASRFGSQCIVGSIEAKRQDGGKWQAYIDNGREPTGLNLLDWVSRLENAGVGEILLTSVDFEGTKRGFDTELVHAAMEATSRPIIISGGYGKPEHLPAVIDASRPSAVAIASAFHYGLASPREVIAWSDRASTGDIAA